MDVEFCHAFSLSVEMIVLFFNIMNYNDLFFFRLIYFILFILAVLGLCCCAQAFSSCGKGGLLFVAVRRLFIAVASLVAEHGL